MLYRYFITVGLYFISTVLMAQSANTGKLIEVLSPNRVAIKLDNDHFINLTLKGPDFAQLAHQPCHKNNAVNAKCKDLKKYLKHHTLGIVLEGRDIEDEIVGDIVVKGQLVSEILVRQGEYRFDSRSSRALYLIAAEKEARCHYRGIWQELLGDFRVSYQCQQL